MSSEDNFLVISYQLVKLSILILGYYIFMINLSRANIVNIYYSNHVVQKCYFIKLFNCLLKLNKYNILQVGT